MNIRAIANSATSVVNPNVTITALKSAGSDTGEDGKRFALWEASTIEAQIQGISSKELQFLAGQGITGTLRQVFAPGYWTGPQKASGTGGDIFRFSERSGSSLRDWKVVQVKGVYDEWTQVIVQMQTAMISLAPQQVVVVSPAVGAIHQQLDVVIVWEPAPGATSYSVYAGTAGGALELAIEGLEATEYNPADMELGTTYFYRVDAVNAHGVTSGAVRSFSTWAATEVETNNGIPEVDENGRYLETGPTT